MIEVHGVVYLGPERQVPYTDEPGRTHIDCPCWFTGQFKQVPCPWHDGMGKYLKGAFEQSGVGGELSYQSCYLKNGRCRIELDPDNCCGLVWDLEPGNTASAEDFPPGRPMRLPSFAEMEAVEALRRKAKGPVKL